MTRSTGYLDVAEKVVEEMSGWKAGKRRLSLDNSQGMKKLRGKSGPGGGGADGRGRGGGFGDKKGGKKFPAIKKW